MTAVDKSGITQVARLRCAIYTRKSSEEGLEQGFNSLDAQREACAAYIQSQKSLGWTLIPESYDDGGYSGGNTERPGLKALLADIRARKVKVVVVYKVDRLTRSLADFAKLVELFDQLEVSFVSVTQQFNTTTSMGRLTLNVLLSFAQFEREVTGERIRDKVAASKQRGMWMGGMAPMGYIPRERTLSIDEVHGFRVVQIFKLYVQLGNVRELKKEIDRRGWKTPLRQTLAGKSYGGLSLSYGNIYRILGNPVYIGKICHKDKVYPGQHPRLIDDELWQQVQDQIAANRQRHKDRAQLVSPSALAGLVFDADGHRLIPTHANKKGRRYRYYVSADLHTGSEDLRENALRIPAFELEKAVIDGIQEFLGDEARLMDWLESNGTEVAHVPNFFKQMASLSNAITDDARKELPGLVQRIMVHPDQLDVGLKVEALLGEATPEEGRGEPVWLTVPVKLHRIGRTMRLVLPVSGANNRKAEKRLIDLLIHAHDWFGRLASGQCQSIGELSAHVGFGGPYVTRVMYLAFLAPDIVERIALGNYPPEMTAERVSRLVPLPTNWEEQRKALGIK